jgi:hypothetical protein
MVAVAAEQLGFPVELCSLEHTRYYWLPTRCRKSDSEAVIDRCVAPARRVPGLVSVARFGGVSVPGISELDRMVVTEPDLGARAATERPEGVEAGRVLRDAAAHADIATAITPPSAGSAARQIVPILLEWRGPGGRTGLSASRPTFHNLDSTTRPGGRDGLLES